MFAMEHTAGDADHVWLYVVFGVIGFVILALFAIFDSSGSPRRWIPKRLRRHRSER